MEARAGACRVVAGERLLCVRRAEAAPGPFRLTVNGDSMARTIALEARKNGALVGRAVRNPGGWCIQERTSARRNAAWRSVTYAAVQADAATHLRARFPGCSIRRVSETEGSLVLCKARRSWEARP